MGTVRADSVQADCVLFEATSGPDVVSFVCLGAGGYAILRDGVSTGTWSEDELDACIRTYLRGIDRLARLPPRCRGSGSDPKPATATRQGGDGRNGSGCPPLAAARALPPRAPNGAMSLIAAGQSLNPEVVPDATSGAASVARQAAGREPGK
jgi:hypothetical protein